MRRDMGMGWSQRAAVHPAHSDIYQTTEGKHGRAVYGRDSLFFLRRLVL